MKIFLVYIRDEDDYQILPEELIGSKPGHKWVIVTGISNPKIIKLRMDAGVHEPVENQVVFLS